MVEIHPIRVETEREEDGRILASVPGLPGVMAYGATADEAIRKVKSIALPVLAGMIESGEEVPAPLRDKWGREAATNWFCRKVAIGNKGLRGRV